MQGGSCLTKLLALLLLAVCYSASAACLA